MKTNFIKNASAVFVCAPLICAANPAESYKSSRQLTSDDQKLNSIDTRIVAEIRKEILDRDGMSMNARNIKIISRNGDVTLNGEVAENSEREWIESRAKSVSNVHSVRNNLKVSSRSTHSTKEKQ